jgi:hypothetical protein
VSSSGSDTRLSSGLTYINAADRLGGFGQAFVSGLGGLVLAIFSIVIGIGESLGAFVTTLVDAQAGSAAALIYGFFRAPGRALQDVWNIAATSLGLDPWNTLGPFVIVIFVGVVILAVSIVTWYLDRRDSDFVGTGTNVPIIGNDEDGDPSDET